MAKAICSRVNLSEQNRISDLYSSAVCDLLEQPDVIRLDSHMQHMNTSRLQHSINVSYYSFRLARLLRADERAAARAGLLHDMYYYEFKNEEITCRQHSRLHPQVALENAKKVTALSEAEEDIILSHMWPMTKKAPSNLEGYIVTFADKGCTLLEVMHRVCRRLVPETIKTLKDAA